jgi:hypothetical protein
LVVLIINEVIARKSLAHILLSTGMSQFTTFEALVKKAVAWPRVEVFQRFPAFCRGLEQAKANQKDGVVPENVS